MIREEAIERFKSRYDKWALDDKDLEAIASFVPELAESGDEKIKKNIIQFFRDASNGKTRVINSNIFAEWADYLENQKEQEPKFYPGDVIKCTSTGSLWVRCKDRDNIRSDGHTACIGGGFELASEEEAVQFFQKLNENGYQWDCIKGRPMKKEQKPAEYEKPLLSKFEQAVYDCAWGKVTCKPEGETQEEYTKRWAEHLLLMVRDWADDYIDSQIELVKRKAYDMGKADAEKPVEWSEKVAEKDLWRDGNGSLTELANYAERQVMEILQVIKKYDGLNEPQLESIKTHLLSMVLAGATWQKEQKPIEWSDNFEENVRNLLHEKLKWTSDDGSMSSAVFIDDKTLKDIISGIWFYVGKEALKYPNKQLNVEQQAAEWSEEDEERLMELISLLKDAEDYLKEHGNMFSYNPMLLIKWLKSLRPSWKLCKEQSEVDLEKFTEKIDSFKERYKNNPERASIKGAMAFMARMFYQYPSVAREWYENLPKATMD